MKVLFRSGTNSALKIDNSLERERCVFGESISIIMEGNSSLSCNTIGNLDEIEVIENSKVEIELGFDLNRIKLANGSLDAVFNLSNNQKSTCELLYTKSSKFTLVCNGGFNMIFKCLNNDEECKLVTSCTTITLQDINILTNISKDLSAANTDEFSFDMCSTLRKYNSFKNKELLYDFMKENGVDVCKINKIIDQNFFAINGVAKSLKGSLIESLPKCLLKKHIFSEVDSSDVILNNNQDIELEIVGNHSVEEN